jgi:diol dehydratase reactivase alpha subunit
MTLIAGVDIGNRTTEVAIGRWEAGVLAFLESDLVPTTGIKGTEQNVEGIRHALLAALRQSECTLEDLEVICINEAAPVIGDLAMSTLTETVITESAMIGHNPVTPGGGGIGLGKTVRLSELSVLPAGAKAIVVVPREVSFDHAAQVISAAMSRKIDVQGAIVQSDDGVLISNRLERVIPIVDEVVGIEDVPIGAPAVVEVAEPGRTICELCNPYGIATLLGLDVEQTKKIAPVAISLIGNRSAVVIKTPEGGIKERRIPAGRLRLSGPSYTCEIDLTAGAEKIVSATEKAQPLTDVNGESGTAVGGMLAKLRETLSKLSGLVPESIKVRDLFAVDSIVPQKVKGGIAGEYRLNQAIALAAMVWTNKSLMQGLVGKLRVDLGVPVHVGGTEVNMALLGALTTPGVEKPVVVLDMGAGSIDAARCDRQGNVEAVHVAGAGDMVTMLIDSELDLNDPSLAEYVKICPAAKIESLFHVRLEDGSLKFFEDPLDSRLFGQVALLMPGGEMLPVAKHVSLKQLTAVRQGAKKRVFLPNIVRALQRISPGRNLRTIDEAVVLGGCALDFELPGFISEMLLKDYGIVTGRGNVRGKLGPRNAVATGLVLSFCKHMEGSLS